MATLTSTALKNTPIGLNLPIRSGKVSGYFDQSTDSFTAYRMNIINLIRTVPGERRMNPTFGCRLWNVTFEPHDVFISAKVENIIKEDIAQWIPGVTVTSIEVKYKENDTSTDLRDIYQLYIVVKFTVDSINQSDVVEIVLNKNKV
jgi:phage baseplate assembly protein W